MIFIGKKRIFEISKDEMNIHYYKILNISYLIELVSKHNQESNFSFESFLNIAYKISFLDYSADFDFNAINKKIEKRINLEKEKQINNCITIKNSVDLSSDRLRFSNKKVKHISYYMKEFRPNIHSRYKHRYFPSLGGLCINRVIQHNNNLNLICYFHHYQWRYKSSWYYCEALIDLGHALGFIKSIGYQTSNIKMTQFFCYYEILNYVDNTDDWLILS